MSNFINNIKLIASELANMSPKTQLEIVKLCKNMCLDVKNYLVELDETTLNNINVSIENLQIAVNNIENELDTAEENITAVQNAIDVIEIALNNRYTKAEVDALLLNFYTKTEVNTLLTNKLNIQTISLSGQSGTLTEEELNKVLNKQNIIIEKDGLYYYKSADVDNYLVFTKLSFDLTLFTNYDAVNKYEINIVKSTGAWTFRAITLYTYTKQQIDALIPHLYAYKINDSDFYSMLYCSEDLDDINIDASTTILTNEQKLALTKLYNVITNKYNGFVDLPSASEYDGIIPINTKISTTANMLLIEFSAYEIGISSVIAEYKFNVVNNTVDSINTIHDNYFGDAFNLFSRSQIF